MAYPDPAAPRSESVSYVVLVAEDANNPGTYRHVKGQEDASGAFQILTNNTPNTPTLDELSRNYEITSTFATFDTPDDPAGQATKRLVSTLEFTTTDGILYRKTFTYDTYGKPSPIPAWVEIVPGRAGLWAMWPWNYPITPDTVVVPPTKTRFASALGMIPNVHS